MPYRMLLDLFTQGDTCIPGFIHFAHKFGVDHNYATVYYPRHNFGSIVDLYKRSEGT